MMEREVVADHYELVRRAKPLLEAVQYFRGLRAKARHVLFSKHTSQKALLDQLQRFSHNADKQPHEDLVLRSRYLFLYRVFRPLIRGDDNQLPKRIDLVRRIAQKQKQAPLRSGQLLQLLLRERDTCDLQRGIALAAGHLRAVLNFKVVGDDFPVGVLDHEGSAIPGRKTGARRHDGFRLRRKRLPAELRLVLSAEPMD